MSLLNSIKKSLDKTLFHFIYAVSSKYNIDEEELMEEWTKVSKMKIKVPASHQALVDESDPSKPKTKKTGKKTSGWMVFSVEQRKIVKEQNPGYDFAEISRVVGKMWSAMSVEEKAAYSEQVAASGSEDEKETKKKRKTGNKTKKSKQPEKDAATVQSEEEEEQEEASVTDDDGQADETDKTSLKENDDGNVIVSGVPVNEEDLMHTDNEEDNVGSAGVEEFSAATLKAKSLKELKDICEQFGIMKTGKKDVLIGRILRYVEDKKHANESDIENGGGSDDDDDKFTTLADYDAEH